MNMPANTSTNSTFLVRLVHHDAETAVQAVTQRIVAEQDPPRSQTSIQRCSFDAPTSRQVWEAQQFRGVVVTGNAFSVRQSAIDELLDVEVEFDSSIDVDFVRTRFAAYGHEPHSTYPIRWTIEGGC